MSVYNFFFISGMHHQECIAPYVDINLHRGRFWASRLLRSVWGCRPQILLHGVQPCDTGTPWWSLPVLWRGGVRIILASASSSICAMCPNMDRRRDWIIAVRLGWFIILFTSSLRTNWCHLIPSKCSQAPLIKSINHTCVHLGDCPAFRYVQKDW